MNSDAISLVERDTAPNKAAGRPVDAQFVAAEAP
jgi:hypothetical protein